MRPVSSIGVPWDRKPVKTSLLPILVCPSCRESLALRADRREAEEVLDGELSCRCGKRFPVRAGVPIFVPESYVRSFSFQWHFQKTDASNEALSAGVKRRFLRAVDKDAAQFSGRRVLDAGCGRRVLLGLLVDHGAEGIGIDMSASRSPLPAACSDFLRHLTTRIRPRLLYLLCHLAVPLRTLQEIPF